MTAGAVTGGSKGSHYFALPVGSKQDQSHELFLLGENISPDQPVSRSPVLW
jgi:hypothetical protein